MKTNPVHEVEDLGPGIAQFDKLEDNEEITPCSGFAAQFCNIDADENVKKALSKFINENRKNGKGNSNTNFIADVGGIISATDDKPLPELATKGFFTMAYPHIFINGSCDFTIKKSCNIDFQQWVTHIYFCCDNRVPAHRFLKFHLLNISNRTKALNQGSFCVNMHINEKQISRDELINRLENNDESIPRKFISMSSNIPNTPPYWSQAKRELDALCFFMLKEESVYPTYFDTSSCAEHRWQPLQTLYFGRVSVKIRTGKN